MKKYNVLKVVGISFLAVVILSWIIPAGTYSSGAYAESGTVPFGLFDLTRVPLIAITNLLQYALIILVIGGLYGVLSKTGVYTTFVDGVSKKFKGKEKRFLVLSILIFTILSSISGATFAILMLVPFFVAVILLMNFNKMTAMLATIGAMLVGNLASVCNSDVVTNLNQYFSLTTDTELLAKIVLLVMVTILYAFFVTKISKVEKPKVVKTEKVKKEEKTTKKTTKSKEEPTKKGAKKTATKTEAKKSEVVTVKEEKVEEKVIPLYDAKAVDKKKSFVPLLVIFLIIFVVALLALFNWSGIFNLTFFDTLYENVMGIKIGDYTIVKNLLGTVSPFGYWTNYELIMFVLLCIPFIAWLYNLKAKDTLDGFVDGAKQMLKPAIMVLFACILYAAMYSNQTGANIFYTIENFLLGLGDKFNALIVAGLSAIGGFFFSDFSAFIGGIAAPITAAYADTTMYPLMGIIIQTVYGFVMFIGPSSMLLLFGLSYFDISYKDWFKTIWKYLWKVLLVIVLVVLVIAMFL